MDPAPQHDVNGSIATTRRTSALGQWAMGPVLDTGRGVTAVTSVPLLSTFACGLTTGKIAIQDTAGGSTYLDLDCGDYVSSICCLGGGDLRQLKLLVGDWGRKVNVYEVQSGALIRTFPCTAWVTSLALDSDLRAVIVGDGSALVNIFGIDGPDHAVQEIACNGVISAVAHAPDHQAVVAADWSGRISVLDLRSGRATQEMVLFENTWPNAVTYMQSTQTIISGDDDGHVLYWDLRKATVRVDATCGDSISTIAHAQDRRSIIVGDGGGKVTIFDDDSGAKRQELQCSGALTSVDYLSETRNIIVGGVEGVCVLSPTASTQKLQPTSLMTVSGIISCMTIGPDFRTLICGDWAGKVTVFDLSARLKRLELRCSAWVNAVAYISDLKAIVSVDDAQCVIVWDISTGVKRLEVKGENSLSALTIAFDKRAIIAGDVLGKIAILDLESGSLRREIEADSGITSLVYAQRVSALISSSLEGRVIIFDFRTGRARRLIECASPVTSLTYIFDTDSIASTEHNGVLSVWEIGSGLKRFEVRPRIAEDAPDDSRSQGDKGATHGGTTSLETSNKNGEIASGGDKSSIMSTADGGGTAIYVHELRAILFADGTTTVFVVEAESGLILQRFACQSPVMAVAFNGRTSQLITGDKAGCIKLAAFIRPAEALRATAQLEANRAKRNADIGAGRRGTFPPTLFTSTGPARATPAIFSKPGASTPAHFASSLLPSFDDVAVPLGYAAPLSPSQSLQPERRGNDVPLGYAVPPSRSQFLPTERRGHDVPHDHAAPQSPAQDLHPDRHKKAGAKGGKGAHGKDAGRGRRGNDVPLDHAADKLPDHASPQSAAQDLKPDRNGNDTGKGVGSISNSSHGNDITVATTNIPPAAPTANTPPAGPAPTAATNGAKETNAARGGGTPATTKNVVTADTPSATPTADTLSTGPEPILTADTPSAGPAPTTAAEKPAAKPKRVKGGGAKGRGR